MKKNRMSTGPKTAQGKMRVAGNSTKHGFYSKQTSLHPVDQAEYAKLKMDIFERLTPVGALEERIAEDLCQHYWELSKIERASRGFYAELASCEAAKRVYHTQTPIIEMGGKLHRLDEIERKMLLEAGRNLEPTAEDIENALTTGVTDDRGMRTTLLIDRRRNSTYRAIKRCDEQFAALQTSRRKKEREEEDEREFQRALQGGRLSVVRNLRRPVATNDGG
jgi:hypothetical protein